MDVFVIPIGPDRYELYCETAAERSAGRRRRPRTVRQTAAPLFRDAARRRGAAAASAPRTDDEPTRAGSAGCRSASSPGSPSASPSSACSGTCAGRRPRSRAHPQDMTFEQVHDAGPPHAAARLRSSSAAGWSIDTLFVLDRSSRTVACSSRVRICSPYYFAFRVVGHWLSMRGAAQGLHRVAWTGRPCPPLTSCASVATLEPPARDGASRTSPTRLRLQHLSTFFERVAVARTPDRG